MRAKKLALASIETIAARLEEDGELAQVGVQRAARLVAPRAAADVPLLPAVASRLSSATGRLAVVTAPGGYGKTTQVAHWAVGDGRTIAWADLEAADNDPMGLLSLLVEVLSGFDGFVPDPPSAARVPPKEFATVVVPAFGRAVERCETPFVLVLDDAHAIDSHPAVDLLAALAWAVPFASTVVVVGRTPPLASLARLRAHRGIVEITTAELALGVSDAVGVLDSMGVRIDQHEVEQLVRETEGWPVGVRLAAAARQTEPNRTAPLNGGIRSYDGDIADYLREEWLSGLTRDEIDFLTQLAILDWMSSDLCDHVLETPGAGSKLQQIHTRRIVMPLDRRHQSYRMHHLLREVLRAELERTDPETVRHHHQRASEWFEANGDIDGAVRHALGSGDLARAERLVTGYTDLLHTNGQYATVTRWLAGFPHAYVTSRPLLCLMAGVSALGAGDGAGAASWVRFGDHALATSGDPDPLTALKLDAFRALLSTTSVSDALADAQRAYQGLPPGIWHAAACMACGVLSFALGDDHVAAALLTEGAAEARISGAPSLEATCGAHLAVIAGWSGDWDRAVPLARSARALLRQHDIEQMPTQILVTAVSALIEAMNGQSELARADWALTRQNMVHFTEVSAWANVQSLVALARTSLLVADGVGARRLVDEAEPWLRAQPDAIRPKAQLAELDELVRAAPNASLWTSSSLSRAELRLLHYLPTHLTLAEIAGELFVSRNTVKSHAASIYRKLGTNSRRDAVDLARAAGLLT